MSTFFERLFASYEGHSLHRPILGWSCFLLLGALFGLHAPSPLVYLSIGTGCLLFSWLTSPRWGSLFLALTLLFVTAWRSSELALKYQHEEATIQRFKASSTLLPVTVTIGDDLRTLTPKRGQPYTLFSAKDVTFEDGTAWVGTSLQIRYYHRDQPPPQRGERWAFHVKLYRTHFSKHLIGSATPDKARHLCDEDKTNGFFYHLGTLRARFAEHLSYGLVDLAKEKALQIKQEKEAQHQECERLVTARDSASPLLIQCAVDDESFRTVERQRGKAYVTFKALHPSFEDGVPIVHTTLRIHFYNNTATPLANGDTFPRPGEQWRLLLTFRKSSSRTPRSMTGSVSSEKATWIKAPPALSNDDLEEESPRFDAITPLRSMLLGAHYKLAYETRETYAKAGIIHIFAISGLHIGILVAFFIFFLRWIKVSLYTQFYLLFPLLISYLLMTGLPPSATRACFMALLYCFASAIFRKGDTLSVLFITASSLVLFDPFLLEHVGALLSFFAIGGIFLFYRPFTLFFAHLFGVEPDIDHPHPQRFVFWRLIRYYFAATLAVSLAAWLSTLPLTLYFFQRLSLIGLVLNLFIPTLTIFIIWSGITSACLGFLCPWISIGLNRMSASLLEMIHLTATRASELPFATLTIETAPHWLLIALLQGLIFVLGLILREKAIRRLQHRLGRVVKRL